MSSSALQCPVVSHRHGDVIMIKIALMALMRRPVLVSFFSVFGPLADKKVIRAYWNGKAPD